MGKKAQAGLEYLMTYGWGLILVATVVGVLVFLLMPPTEVVRFSSSDPTKMVVEGSAAGENNAKIKLINLTGGEITITGIDVTSGYTGCTANGDDPPVEKVGTKIDIECIGEGPGIITITYTDRTNLTRTVTLKETGAKEEQGPGFAAFSCTVDNPSFPMQSYDVPASSHSDHCGEAPPYEEWYSADNTILLRNDSGGSIVISEVWFWSEAGSEWLAWEDTQGPEAIWLSEPEAAVHGGTARFAMASIAYVCNYQDPEGELGTINDTLIQVINLGITQVPVPAGGDIEIKQFNVYHEPGGGHVPPGKIKLTTDTAGDVIIECTGFPSEPSCS